MARIAIILVFIATAVLSCSDDGSPPPIDADPSICMGGMGYLQNCANDGECGACMCRSFGHSMVCTKACVNDSECPGPSGGCSVGFCRP